MKEEIRSRLNDHILAEARRCYGISPDQFEELGGFESFIYGYEKAGQRYVLRLGHSQRRSPNLIRGEVDWINHLAPEDTALKPFFAAYRKKYNDECKEFANGVLAYDSMYWLADAVKRAGKADPKAIAKALESTKGLKLLHATITIDPATHTPLDKVGVVLVAKEGKSMLFKKIKP